jgi:hypothetical protein
VIDYVQDDEVLYRRVLKNHYQMVGGKPNLSSQAFTDRKQAPSVDRAVRCKNNPNFTQKDYTDSVVSLLTCDVRATDTVKTFENGVPKITYKIDVVSVPLIGISGETDNLAHAEIRPNPEYKGDKPFKRLRERLAFLANTRWEILPYELR